MRILLTCAIMALLVCGCGGGGSSGAAPQPPVTDLVWDQGNWDELNWQ